MAGGRHGAQQKLGPGENSIATAKMQVIRDKDGNVTLRKLQWRICLVDDEGNRVVKKYTTQSATMSETRLREAAKAKAKSVQEAWEHPEREWSPSRKMEEFIATVALPQLDKATYKGRPLRPRTKERYVAELGIFRQQCRGLTIAAATRAATLDDVFKDIALAHGTTTAKQTRKVVSKYVMTRLVKEGAIDVNPLRQFDAEDLPAVRLGNKPKGGQVLTADERAAVITWLLAADPTCERGKRGYYTAEQRTARRKLAIDATLLQAACGLRIAEVRRLTRRHVYEREGWLTVEVTDEVSKTHEGREVPVFDARVADRIRERLRSLPEGVDVLVFGAPAKPDRVWDASNAQKAVRQLYDEMADALDIPLLREVSSHVWRATNNTIMRDKGMLPEVRAALFGHSEETNHTYYTAGLDVAAVAAQGAEALSGTQ